MREAIKFTFIAAIIFGGIICIIIWPYYGFASLAFFLIALGLHDIFQKKHTILRNFPIIGHMRFLLEMIGAELHQYFVESNTDGKPIDKNHRDYIYERAKLQMKPIHLVQS